MLSSLIIIPTYNEKENVEKMVRAIFSLPENFHILIIDDNSPDATSEIVKNLQFHFKSLFLLQRKGKQGLGTAYIEGFKWAIERSYDFIFEMDCDFSHDPGDLRKLRNACEKGADMSIGSRYCKGGKVHNWPITRILMSYFASVYVRFVLWIHIHDTTAGFVCYKREVLKNMDLEEVKFKGYAFQIEMKYRALKMGYRLVEVPIIFKDRLEGVSKMSTKIFKEAFWGVLLMRKIKIKTVS